MSNSATADLIDGMRSQGPHQIVEDGRGSLGPLAIARARATAGRHLRAWGRTR